jgi:hypothetical protein
MSDSTKSDSHFIATAICNATLAGYEVYLNVHRQEYLLDNGLTPPLRVLIRKAGVNKPNYFLKLSEFQQRAKDVSTYSQNYNAILCHNNEDNLTWLIPMDEILGLKAIRLGSKFEKFLLTNKKLSTKASDSHTLQKMRQALSQAQQNTPTISPIEILTQGASKEDTDDSRPRTYE